MRGGGYGDASNEKRVVSRCGSGEVLADGPGPICGAKAVVADDEASAEVLRR